MRVSMARSSMRYSGCRAITLTLQFELDDHDGLVHFGDQLIVPGRIMILGGHFGSENAGFRIGIRGKQRQRKQVDAIGVFDDTPGCYTAWNC